MSLLGLVQSYVVHQKRGDADHERTAAQIFLRKWREAGVAVNVDGAHQVVSGDPILFHSMADVGHRFAGYRPCYALPAGCCRKQSE